VNRRRSDDVKSAAAAERFVDYITEKSLSLGLEDWHDIIADLDAPEVV
jgi:hypothetical protein